MKLTLNRNGTLIRSEKCEGIFKNWQTGTEKWLFISPHDDDICIGAGLLLQQAGAEGIQIRVAIVSDGRGGYCDLDDRDSITAIRKKETTESFELLGIKDVMFLGYPDGDLVNNSGRRLASDRSGQVPDVREGYSGLQNSFTAILREFRPTRLFVMSESDYHPDHKVVYRELMISVFHAAGAIWPELGPPVLIPEVYEMAGYCNFLKTPNLQLEANQNALKNKLASIACYKSQKQIALLVDNIRKNGPYEYFMLNEFNLYNPAEYKQLFE
jgi:LmbE family N-acetylglucosaminyl deacetylase